MAAFDYKKEYPALYLPKETPSIVTIPPVQVVAVEGRGDPNEEGGEYASALSVLYAVSYTIKMSPKAGRALEGFFEYVVPPLEGLWWMEDGRPGIDYAHKEAFCWLSMIRLPEFVTEDVFGWAKEEAARKKGLDTSRAKLTRLDEGLCVQCLHVGPYDKEPDTVEKLDRFLEENGYRSDFSDSRRHHEIYLSDPRRVAPEKRKTVIRQPVAPKAGT